MAAVYASEVPSSVRPALPVSRQERSAQKAGLRRRIDSVAVLYAHALLLEQEAVERYGEFSMNMAERGNDEVAELFRQLAEFDAEHAFRLAKRTGGMKLPRLAAAEHAWLDKEAPVPEAHAFVYRMLTPRMALEIALREEERARAFFERVLAESSDAGIRKVARELLRDEEAHVAWVTEALARVPQPYLPSEEMPGDPTIAQQL
jgi:rubrerythrin